MSEPWTPEQHSAALLLSQLTPDQMAGVCIRDALAEISRLQSRVAELEGQLPMMTYGDRECAEKVRRNYENRHGHSMADDMAATEIIAAHRGAAVRELREKYMRIILALYCDKCPDDLPCDHACDEFDECFDCLVERLDKWSVNRALLVQAHPTAAQGGE